jgi:hypothetical protein
MSEYGDIFDYQASAMIFEALTLGFIAAYGLAVVFIAAHSKSRDLGASRIMKETVN